MSAKEGNVELVMRGMAAYNDGDIDAILETLDPDVELIPMRSLLDGRSYRGHDGARQFLTDMAEEWEDIHIEPEEIRDLGDRVLVLGKFQARGRASGVEVDAPAAWLSELRDGKTIVLRAYPNRKDALREIGE
jgi:ketosteroid isomerase-like protein